MISFDVNSLTDLAIVIVISVHVHHMKSRVGKSQSREFVSYPLAIVVSIR